MLAFPICGYVAYIKAKQKIYRKAEKKRVRRQKEKRTNRKTVDLLFAITSIFDLLSRLRQNKKHFVRSAFCFVNEAR